jgi:hypothetical protein
MICENQMDSCLPWQNSTVKNPHSLWRWNGRVAPPPRPAPPRPEMPLVPPVDSEQNQSTEIAGAPCEYVSIHTPLSNTQFFNHDAYAKDCKRDQDFHPHLLTDQGPSLG